MWLHARSPWVLNERLPGPKETFARRSGFCSRSPHSRRSLRLRDLGGGQRLKSGHSDLSLQLRQGPLVGSSSKMLFAHGLEQKVNFLGTGTFACTVLFAGEHQV